MLEVSASAERKLPQGAGTCRASRRAAAPGQSTPTGSQGSCQSGRLTTRLGAQGVDDDCPREPSGFVEDLCVTGLARTRLAQSVHDAGWSRFVGMSRIQGRTVWPGVRQSGPLLSVSQLCSACMPGGDGPKPLSIREWTCTACGAVHDRDLNAARTFTPGTCRVAKRLRRGCQSSRLAEK